MSLQEHLIDENHPGGIELQSKNPMTTSTIIKKIAMIESQVCTKMRSKGISYQLFPRLDCFSFVRDLEDMDNEAIFDQVGQSSGYSQSISTLATFLAPFKMMIVSGILFVPRAFLNGGWLASVVWCLLLACLGALNIGWINKAYLTRERSGRQLALSELARSAMGNIGAWVVIGLINVTRCTIFVVNCIVFNLCLQHVAKYF